MILTCFIIPSPNNNDNIFLNKNINRLLVDIGKTNYKVEYTNDYKPNYVIIFAENVKLIKNFIDDKNIKNKKCVAITQEGFHETSEDDKIYYNDNEILIYCPYNNKFYLNIFYNYYGIPGGIIDLSYKTEEKYNTDLLYFGNIWRENWDKKYSLYYERTKIAIEGYIGGYIKQIYSRDFYPINNYDIKYEEIENKIKLINNNVIKNVNRDEKIKLTSTQYYSLEFLPINIINFTSERPFDAICCGCVPIFLGNETIKKYFPTDTIIYIDEFNSLYECFDYVKKIKYNEWKIRIEKCIKILHDLNQKGLNGDNMIIQLFKNVVDDLFKNEFKFNNYILCGGRCMGTTITNTLFKNNFTTAHVHTRYGGRMFMTNFNINYVYELICYNSIHDYVYVIDNYRTPIEREISSFILNINVHVKNLNTFTVDELTELYLNNYFYKLELYHPLDDFKFFLGILQEYPNQNDFSRGYMITNFYNLKLIKILDSSNLENILTNIYNKKITIYELNKSCITEPLIIEFKKKFMENKLSPKYLLNIYSDFYFHIYCQNKNQYINKYFDNNYFLDYKTEGKYLINLFNSNIPLFMTRLGGTDFINAFHNIFSDESFKNCCEYSGYFDNGYKTMDERNDNIKKYYNIIKKSVDNSFICSYVPRSSTYVKNKILISYSFIEDVYPFLIFFKIIGNNKKILIISPFSETIKHQYKYKNDLISGYEYPNFELITYDLPITYSDNGKNLNTNVVNWIEQSNLINDEISKIDFDIALISGASYTYSIGNFIANIMKKKAIYIGGILNVLFAIKSNRYHRLNSGYEKINPKNMIIEPFELYKISNINVGRIRHSEALCAYFGVDADDDK